MRRAKQSQALSQHHNGDSVREKGGAGEEDGEGEQTEHKGFTNNLSQGIQQDRSDWAVEAELIARTKR